MHGLGQPWYTFTIPIRGVGSTAVETCEHALESFHQAPRAAPKNSERDWYCGTEEQTQWPTHRGSGFSCQLQGGTVSMCEPMEGEAQVRCGRSCA